MQMKRLLDKISKTKGIKTGVRIIIIFSATAYFSGCIGNQCNQKIPTILPFSEFRSGVKWQAPIPIRTNGKIILYKNFLFVNEPSKGIHVFDNSQSDNPIALGFLSIPGNSDIVIKDDIIYAESYTDIVLIGVSESGTLAEVDRITFAFQFRYDHTYYGVITGYRYENKCSDR